MPQSNTVNIESNHQLSAQAQRTLERVFSVFVLENGEEVPLTAIPVEVVEYSYYEQTFTFPRHTTLVCRPQGTRSKARAARMATRQQEAVRGLATHASNPCPRGPGRHR